MQPHFFIDNRASEAQFLVAAGTTFKLPLRWRRYVKTGGGTSCALDVHEDSAPVGPSSIVHSAARGDRLLASAPDMVPPSRTL